MDKDDIFIDAKLGLDEEIRYAAALHRTIIKARDNLGRTPLHIAAQHGQLSALLTLIDCGAEIDARSYDGCTPAHLAAREGKYHTLCALAFLGADFNVVSNDGRSVFDCLPDRYKGMFERSIDIINDVIRKRRNRKNEKSNRV